MKIIKNKRYSNSKKLRTYLLLILIISCLAGIFSYVWYYNYWPFSNDDVTGLPDNHLRLLEETSNSPGTLLFMNYDSYEMNYSGKEVTMYLDYYEKNKKIESILVSSLLSEGETNYSGLIDWGITKDTEDTENQTLYSELNLSGMGSSSQNSLSFLSELLKEHVTYAQLINDKIELTKNEPIPLYAWSSGGTYYVDFQDNFTEEAMKNREGFAVLYLIVK